MTTQSKQSIFVFHGKIFEIKKFGFVPVVDINEYATENDLKKGKGCCILAEVIMVVSQGKKYKLLGNRQKYLDDLKVVNPRSVFCVELAELQPHTERMVSKQSTYLPPVPLQLSLGNAAEKILSEPDLYASFDGCYPDELVGTTDSSRIISQIIGKNAYNERSVRKRRENLSKAKNDNKDPRNVDLDTLDTENELTTFLSSVNPELRNRFDEKAQQSGGFNFNTVISLAPEEDQEKFVRKIEEKMSAGNFDNFFHKIQVKAKRHLETELESRV